MKIIPIIYTVRGTGPFPIDMLREDGSCPYSDRDSSRIMISMDDAQGQYYNFQITLVKHDGYRYWTPNLGTWKSFGWEVTNIEEKRT